MYVLYSLVLSDGLLHIGINNGVFLCFGSKRLPKVVYGCLREFPIFSKVGSKLPSGGIYIYYICVYL